VHEDGWVKDAAPSDGLRNWFSHDAEKWAEFQRKYFAELKAAGRGTVTLLYSSHETEHNNSVAVKRYLEAAWESASVQAKAVVKAGWYTHRGSSAW
jgi:uncharacterized protein YeaO (DUF488 family)